MSISSYFLYELNNFCVNKNNSNFIKWNHYDIMCIREGIIRNCSDDKICEECRKMTTRIRNFYSDISIEDLKNRIDKLENKI
jgi:hypothetical protein